MNPSVHEPEVLPTKEVLKVSPWHVRKIEEIFTELSSDAALGLSETESSIRLAKDGPNILPETKGTSIWVLLLRQVKSIVIWVLIAAGVVSAFLGEGVDAIAIFTIVFLNALVGFYQEYGAEKSISALRKMTAPSAKVRRDAKVRSLPASEIVRGDLIEFESGDLVPADARLVEASDLRCVESALTGESEAVEKTLDAIPEVNLAIGDRKNMVFMGTSVASGTGRAVVVGTALSTEIGRIASLLDSASAEESTPLQKRLDSLGRTLVWFTLGLVVLLFLLGLWRGMEPFQLLLTAIGLAVAATPESLPAVVTVALALGVQRMAKRNALVRRLASVETLGSANVICTDKTGTLTAGEMTVKELYTAGNIFQVEGIGLDPKGGIRLDGHEPDESQTGRLRRLAAIQVGTVTAALFQEEGRWKVSGDPTEGALLTSAQKVGLVGESPPKVYAYPFDSDRKRASVIIKEKDGTFRILVNGAPDVLLGLCSRFSSPTGDLPLNDRERVRILEANTAMASRGLRVIGSAQRGYAMQGDKKPAAKDLETDLVFVGLAGMYDPPRPEARDAVAKCRKAGIRVVMITGDHPATAQAIGKDLGILEDVSGVLTGNEVTTLDEAALAERVQTTAIYARVSAEHKLRIVKAWRAGGSVVAMTGDGVNDAPAIMGAHIGIAMGRTGTEVTKQASDMVIADDNFASIVAAVEEGRGIYQNIRNTLQFLLGGNVGELLLMMVAIIAGLPAPLLAIHLLWINLVTDGLPALCLAAERIEPDIMEHKPRQQAEIMSDRRFLLTLILTGVLTAGTSLAVFLWALETRGLEEARSYAFATLVFSELLRSLGARSEFKSIWKMDLRGNINLLLVVAVSIAFQIFSHHNDLLGVLLKTSPISSQQCIVLLGISTIPMVVLELFKLVYPGLPRKAAA